ncbi:MAG: Ig-like domain-containing protein, partial [Planctomycetes bacterium]|nr:Ig-like domain-containing protein [Planctomycetota bacterium]
MALPIGPVGPRLAAALLLLLAFPAVLPAGDAPDARRHLDPLAAEVEEALESASDPRTRRTLLSARDLLLSPGGGLEQDAARLRSASRLLEKRVKDRPALAAAAGSALRGLLDDADWEYASLSGAVDALDPGAALRTRAKVEGSLAAARALAASSPSRGARSLLAAARVLGDLRLPPSPNYGGAFRVVSFAPPTGDLVGLNQEVVVVFSGPLDPRSVRPDTFQVRIGPNFQSQAPGSLVVSGNTVVFRPRLPAKPDRTDGGFPPGVKIRVTTVGYPSTNLILGKGRRPLDRTLTAEFTTAAVGGLLYDFTKFPDDPPPRLRETWPADVLPSAPFDGPGGAAGVETAVLPVLRLARVPLDPATLPGRVRLLALDLRGRPTSLEVPGTTEVDQDDREVRLRFRPSATLADRSRYALRIEPGVMDLSGQFEMALHGGRSALYAAAAAEAAGEGGPLADLAAAHPEAVDPRTYLLFTTRDEPASDRQVVLRFDGTDRPVDGGDGSDPGRTTASYDAAVPGAVAAAIAAA